MNGYGYNAENFTRPPAPLPSFLIRNPLDNDDRGREEELTRGNTSNDTNGTKYMAPTQASMPPPSYFGNPMPSNIAFNNWDDDDFHTDRTRSVARFGRGTSNGRYNSYYGNQVFFDLDGDDNLRDESKVKAQDVTSPKKKAHRRDLLTVFQAEPLAFELQGGMHPVPQIDFDAEREMLIQSVKESERIGAKIELEFEPATIDRLGAFLDKGKGRVLHFSAHGDPRYLMIENGWGAGIPFKVERLKRRMAAGKNALQFVFVSACYSRSSGMAFVEAGVPHVICCRQNSTKLSNSSANIFSSSLYRALACGRTLVDAFDAAREQVMVSVGHIDTDDFMLLPEDGDHNKPIFFTDDDVQASSETPYDNQRTQSILPPPPDVFVGREIDMFYVLEELKRSRLVRVTGPRGIGKGSLVKAVTNYINKRHITDKILWLPDFQQEASNSFVAYFSRFLKKCCGNESELDFENGTQHREHQQRIINELSCKRTLIVIDVRNFQGVRKLWNFLRALFLRTTRNVKVITIHRQEGEQLNSNDMPCVESEINLGQLDCAATVQLFGRIWGSVSKEDLSSLLSLLVPPGANSNSTNVLSKRSARIFKLLGEGYPAEIHKAARTMSQSEFNKLVSLGRSDDFHVSFASRVELEERMALLLAELEDCVGVKEDFDRAQQIEASLNQFELLRDELHDLGTLKTLIDQVQEDKRVSIDSHDYEEAKLMKAELRSLKAQLKIEVEATLKQIEKRPEAGADEATLQILVEQLISSKKGATESRDNLAVAKLDKQLELLAVRFDVKVNTKEEVTASYTCYSGHHNFDCKTRASLENEISKLEKDFQEAINANYHEVDYLKAENIDKRIKRLESRRKLLPTSKELEDEVERLKIKREELVRERNLKDLKVLDRKLIDVDRRLKLEEAAAIEIQTSGGCCDSNPTVSVSSVNSNDSRPGYGVASMPRPEAQQQNAFTRQSEATSMPTSYHGSMMHHHVTTPSPASLRFLHQHSSSALIGDVSSLCSYDPPGLHASEKKHIVRTASMISETVSDLTASALVDMTKQKPEPDEDDELEAPSKPTRKPCVITQRHSICTSPRTMMRRQSSVEDTVVSYAFLPSAPLFSSDPASPFSADERALKNTKDFNSKKKVVRLERQLSEQSTNSLDDNKTQNDDEQKKKVTCQGKQKSEPRTTSLAVSDESIPSQQSIDDSLDAPGAVSVPGPSAATASVEDSVESGDEFIEQIVQERLHQMEMETTALIEATLVDDDSKESTDKPELQRATVVKDAIVLVEEGEYKLKTTKRRTWKRFIPKRFRK